MTLTSTQPQVDAEAAPTRRTGKWIDDWRPEEEEFWAETGAPIARRNLIWSIFAEHLGFSVWLIWSVSSAFLLAQGFEFTPQQLFFLVAIPNLVGSLLRVPYTLAVGWFGGRNWTMVSAALLLVPTLGFAYAVTDPSTPYWAFCLIAATAGLGGGNFASSMANINFFYPSSKKGAALGLNAAGGNLGVALIQFFLPAIVGGAAIFGLVTSSAGGIHLERAAWVYAGLAVIATIAAYFLMDNLGTAKASPKEQLSVLKHKQTWVMSFLYIGTFGSFIGYSAAMPLLIKLNFWRQPVPNVVGIGINFAFYAFLGALVGSMARPLGGYLADRFGGAKVTLFAFGGMVLGTLGVLYTLSLLKTLPPPPSAEALAAIKADPASFKFPPAVADAVNANGDVFPFFLGMFLLVFLFIGIGNGSTYKMIPAIFKTEADRATTPGTPEREAATLAATKKSSAAVGLIGAVGAIGGFLIPITFGSPWVTDPPDATKTAFMIFTTLMEAAGTTGRRDAIITAFQADVLASCVGPVTAAAFELWGVPTIHPDRSRLAAMIKQLEIELPSRRRGMTLEVAGHVLLLHGDEVLIDGVEVKLSPAPFALLQALVVNPGHVVSRRELLAALPGGTATSEHAVEMAVARLRAALGTRLVQTVVKRGYRLAVSS